MYTLSEQQIDFILLDIKNRGVEMEDLQLNLLDHICCILESECKPEDNFETIYQQTISRFFRKELKEIEEETLLLLTFKNYYAMKKTMLVSGTTAVIFLMAGSLFKLMHWPGAGAMLVLGVFLLSLIFLPLLFLTKSKEAASSQNKVVIGLGAFVGILYCLSTLFKVMHWPGASILWFSTVGLSAFAFIPLYFFTGIKNPDTKTTTIVTSILLVGATSILFMLLNVRPPKKELQLKMYNYLQSEAVLTRMHASHTSAAVTSNENTKMLDEINLLCTQLKTLIVENATGETSIPADFEAKNILIEDGGLGNDFYDEGRGAKLMAQLKDVIVKYNAQSSTPLPQKNSALDSDFGNIANYNVYTVLNSLTQLQLFVATLNS